MIFFHRCYVTKKAGSLCEVLFVDFGDLQRVNVKELKMIPYRYMEVPCQGVLLSMPISENWEHEPHLAIRFKPSKKPELCYYLNNAWRKLE